MKVRLTAVLLALAFLFTTLSVFAQGPEKDQILSGYALQKIAREASVIGMNLEYKADQSTLEVATIVVTSTRRGVVTSTLRITPDGYQLSKILQMPQEGIQLIAPRTPQEFSAVTGLDISMVSGIENPDSVGRYYGFVVFNPLTETITYTLQSGVCVDYSIADTSFSEKPLFSLLMDGHGWGRRKLITETVISVGPSAVATQYYATCDQEGGLVTYLDENFMP